MSGKVRVVQYGCGVIGSSIVRLASQKSSLEIVGAIDRVNVGVDLGEVAGLEYPLGVRISRDVDEVLRKGKPDIVLHATGSVLREVYPELESVARAGIDLISTNEPLSYPFGKEARLASRMDRVSKKHGVTVLGTGVNPGFVMDVWPLAMTAVCQEVKKIKVVRVQDASLRRASFQRKIGVGTSLEEFKRLAGLGNFGHVGLTESIGMISAGLGWSLEEVRESMEPILAEEEVKSEFFTVKRGEVAGVHQIARGLKEGQEVITLDFQARIGSKLSYDAVYITGVPDLQSVIEGGVPGDIATAAVVVNAIPRVINAPPGLLTMKDLSLVCAF